MNILAFSKGSRQFNPSYDLESFGPDGKKKEFRVVIGVDWSLTGDGRAPTMLIYFYDKAYGTSRYSKSNYPIPVFECPSRTPDAYIRSIGQILLKVDTLDELLDILKLENLL